MSALVVWNIVKSGFGSVMAFLGKLSPAELLCIALALFAGVQTLRLSAEKRHSAKVEAQLTAATQELQRITSARDTQTKTSERTVTQVIQGQERVRTVVKTIHDAPNPPDCGTPDLAHLREVL